MHLPSDSARARQCVPVAGINWQCQTFIVEVYSVRPHLCLSKAPFLLVNNAVGRRLSCYSRLLFVLQGAL